MTDLRSPGGDPPPPTARLDDGNDISLGPLARRISDLYYSEFPEEIARYGAAGRDWCVHDNQHLLAWAFGAHRGYVVFGDEVRWLASVLSSRGYPLEHLSWDLRTAASVLADTPISEAGQIADILREGADVVAHFRVGA
jgi:hypothetical protein